MGTWEIIGKKVLVYVDKETLNLYFEDILKTAGFPGDTTVHIYKAQVMGKQKKDSLIKGKYKFQATVESSGS